MKLSRAARTELRNIVGLIERAGRIPDVDEEYRDVRMEIPVIFQSRTGIKSVPFAQGRGAGQNM